MKDNKGIHAQGKRFPGHNSNTPGIMLKSSNTVDAIKKKKETWIKTGRGVGAKNSQSGTMWVTDGHTNAKIKKTEVIPDGWKKGRVIARVSCAPKCAER